MGIHGVSWSSRECRTLKVFNCQNTSSSSSLGQQHSPLSSASWSVHSSQPHEHNKVPTHNTNNSSSSHNKCSQRKTPFCPVVMVKELTATSTAPPPLPPMAMSRWPNYYGNPSQEFSHSNNDYEDDEKEPVKPGSSGAYDIQGWLMHKSSQGS